MKFELDKYYFPRALDSDVQETHKEIPDNKFFVPRNQPIMEAWCAAKFGLWFEKYIGSCEVKVNSQSFPDFFLKYNGCEFWFENTEVLEEGRQRTKEYKEKSHDSIVHISQAELEYNEVNAPEWIKNAIKKKANRYRDNARSTNLVIYVNITLFHEIDIKKIKKACMEYEDTFQSIWILTGKYVGALFMSHEQQVYPRTFDKILRYN